MKNELIGQYIGNSFKHYQLIIKTLTPLAIRTDEYLSAYIDYHIQDKKLYRIDTEKLLNDLLKNEWIDDYERQVEKYTKQGIDEDGKLKQPEQKNNFLEDFLKERNVRIATYLKDNPVDFFPKENDKWVQLRTTVKTKGLPYIPGSSLKGAIRTAVLYNWLVYSEEGKKQLKELIESFINKTDKIKYENLSKLKKELFEIKNLLNKKDELDEELSEKLDEEYKSKRKININNKNEFQKIIEKNRINILNYINTFEEKINNLVFGKQKDNIRDAASFFKLADSKSIDTKYLAITSLSKKYREDNKLKEKKKEFTTCFQEFIKEGIITRLNLSIPLFELDWRKQDKVGYFASMIYKKENLSEIFSKLNCFSSDYLEFELERLNMFYEKLPNDFDREDLSDYKSQLEVLKKEIKELNSNEAILCLGFGKSIFLNTVLLAIRKQFSEVFEYIAILLTRSKHPRPNEFPFSHYCVSIKNKDTPIGWIKISDTNNTEKNIAHTISALKVGEKVDGILFKVSNPSKVKIILDGKETEVNANGIKKIQPPLAEGEKCKIEIKCIKDGIIKDAYFVK